MPDVTETKDDSDHDELSYFEDSLSTIFDDIIVSHGSPGESIVYESIFGPLSLKLTLTSTWEEQLKFSHFLWNAELNLAKRIETQDVDLRGLDVLELGAGAGLCGILAVLAGAKRVVLSDYPAESMMANLKHNVESLLGPEQIARTKIVPHLWGEDTSVLTEGSRFDVILLADCLWMPEQHEPLCQTLRNTLKESSEARIYCVAGFHSGRAKMAPFFDKAKEVRLIPDIIFELDAKGSRREWDAARTEEDSVVRKRWLTIANLKWS